MGILTNNLFNSFMAFHTYNTVHYYLFEVGTVAHPANFRTKEAEAGALPWIWGQLGLPLKFQASFLYIIGPRLK